MNCVTRSKPGIVVHPLGYPDAHTLDRGQLPTWRKFDGAQIVSVGGYDVEHLGINPQGGLAVREEQGSGGGVFLNPAVPLAVGANGAKDRFGVRDRGCPLGSESFRSRSPGKFVLC